MKDVDWQPKALKQLKKLKDPTIQKRIVRAAGELQRFPEVANIKTLNHHEHEYRLQVGD